MAEVADVSVDAVGVNELARFEVAFEVDSVLLILNSELAEAGEKELVEIKVEAVGCDAVVVSVVVVKEPVGVVDESVVL